jgi:hypothetical protein
VHKTDDFKERMRKRPTKPSANGRIVRKLFGEDYSKELHIPKFIDDYNHYMGGIDLTNQYRVAYETHRTTFRNWWPLFY